MTAPRTIRPLGNRVLVQFAKQTEQISGGILIPESAQEAQQEAVVVALGKEAKSKSGDSIPFVLKVGDKVLIGKFGGSQVKLAEERYTIISEDDVLGVLA